jgi:hypothetical protein
VCGNPRSVCVKLKEPCEKELSLCFRRFLAENKEATLTGITQLGPLSLTANDCHYTGIGIGSVLMMTLPGRGGIFDSTSTKRAILVGFLHSNEVSDDYI